MSLRTILLAGIATLLPVELGAQQPQATAQGMNNFSPPPNPLVLSRTVWRSLPDGKHIMVQRNYEVRFAAEGDGYIVDGALIDTVVEAPPPVAMLADLERSRADAGPFPLHLDRQGQIIKTSADVADRTARTEATRTSALILNQLGRSTLPRVESLEALNRVLAAANGGAAWPVDLFNPTRNRHHEIRKVALPTGNQGEVDVSISVEASSPGNLPQQFERMVITRLGSSERVSREVWSFHKR